MTIPRHLADSWQEQPNNYLYKIYEKHKNKQIEWGTAEYSDGGSCGRVKYPRLKIKHGDLIYLFSQHNDCKTQLWVFESEVESEKALFGGTICYKHRRAPVPVFDIRECNVHIGLKRTPLKTLEEVLDFIKPAEN